MVVCVTTKSIKERKLVLAIDKQLENEGCKWWACKREEGRVGWCSGGVWWWMKRERERVLVEEGF